MKVWHPRIVNLSPATIKRYESAYVMYIREQLGRRPISQIKMNDVQMWVNKLMTYEVSRSGHGKEKNRMAPKTVRFVYSVLANIFHCAEWSDVIVKSPCNPLVTLPEEPYTEPETYSVAEAVELIETAPNRLKLPFFLALFLGLRLGEVSGLKWEDLDRLTLTLKVQRQVDGDGNESEPKTARSRRVIPLTKSIVEFIDQHGDIDHQYIIGMTRRTLEREWRKALPKGKRFHGLRAGNAGLITYLTGSTKIAADMLGHSSTDMTEKHYIGRSNDAMRGAVEALTHNLTNKRGVK